MRNLKRALSLTLASVMLLGMMVVGAGAAGFPDVDEDNANIEAIEVLQAVEVMIGDDNGNFGPNDPVNRSQMAVVMAKLLNLDYKYYEASCPFWDVPTWARPYVGACYANKIVSGYGDGTYGAADGVTPVQAASMMMRALGYFQHSEDYKDGFETVTVRQGTQIGIFDGVGSSANAEMTRAQVARMALNALESEMVTFTGVPGTTYTTSTGEQLSIGYRAEYTPRTSTEIKYQAIEQRTSDVSGGNNLNRGQYYIQLGEELYNGKLTKRYARDDFERPSINWQYNGKDIGTYVDYDLLVNNGSYTTGVKFSELYELLTYTTINENDVLRFEDGVTRDIDKKDFNRSNKDEVGGTGALTEVFLDQERDEIIITTINTYLAKANSDYNKTNETLSLKVYVENEKGMTKVVDSAEVPAAENVAKDEYRLVYMSGKDSGAAFEGYSRYDVVNIFDIEIMEAAEITKWSKSAPKVAGKLTTGGTEYSTNRKAYYDYGNVLDDYDLQLLSDMTYNIYMDRYGNVIGVDLHEGNLNYVFITGYDRGKSNISVKTADAAAIFTDGTMDTITVNVSDTNKNIRSAKAVNAKDPNAYREYDEWTLNAGGNQANGGDRNLNRWYTYTVSANGNYTLKPVKNFIFTAYGDSAFDKDGVKILDCANLFLDDSSAINKLPVNSDKGRVYGEDDSIYITVDTSYVDTSGTNVEGGRPEDNDAITEVEGVYTGAQDIKIELTKDTKGLVNNDKDKNTALEYAQESAAERDAYVYTIFDNDNYIIASIVMGDAQGAAANYVYVLDGAKNERVERASGNRASSGDTYYWEFDAVVDGEITTLTVKEKYSSTLKNDLNIYGIVEIRYDGDYVVDIKNVDDDDIFYYWTDENKKLVQSGEIEDKDVYDVGNSVGSGWSKSTSDWRGVGQVHNTVLMDKSGKYAYNYNLIDRIEGTIYLQGRTLYVDNNYVNDRDIGLGLSRDAKAVLVQPENGKLEKVGCGTVQEAIDRLSDRNPEATNPGIQFKGRIAAVLDGRGVAKWVVIISDTNLVTGNTPDYGTNDILRWSNKEQAWELDIPWSEYKDWETQGTSVIYRWLMRAGCSDVEKTTTGWDFTFKGVYNKDQKVIINWIYDDVVINTANPNVPTVTTLADGATLPTASAEAGANYTVSITWTKDGAAYNDTKVNGAGTYRWTVTLTANRGYAFANGVQTVYTGTIVVEEDDNPDVPTDGHWEWSEEAGGPVWVPGTAAASMAKFARAARTGGNGSPFDEYMGQYIRITLENIGLDKEYTVFVTTTASGATTLKFGADLTAADKKEIIDKMNASGLGQLALQPKYQAVATPDQVEAWKGETSAPVGSDLVQARISTPADFSQNEVGITLYAYSDTEVTAELAAAAINALEGMSNAAIKVNESGELTGKVTVEVPNTTSTREMTINFASQTPSELFKVTYPGVGGTKTVYVAAGDKIEDIADKVLYLIDATVDCGVTGTDDTVVTVTAKTPSAKSNVTLTNLNKDRNYVEAFKIGNTSGTAAGNINTSGQLIVTGDTTAILQLGMKDKTNQIVALDVTTTTYVRAGARIVVQLVDGVKATAKEGDYVEMNTNGTVLATKNKLTVTADKTLDPAEVTVPTSVSAADKTITLTTTAVTSASSTKNYTVTLNGKDAKTVNLVDADEIPADAIWNETGWAKDTKVYYEDPADGKLKDASLTIDTFGGVKFTLNDTTKEYAGDTNTIKLYTVYTVAVSTGDVYSVFDVDPATEGAVKMAEALVVKTTEAKELWIQAGSDALNAALTNTAGIKMNVVKAPDQTDDTTGAVYKIQVTSDIAATGTFTKAIQVKTDDLEVAKVEVAGTASSAALIDPANYDVDKMELSFTPVVDGTDDATTKDVSKVTVAWGDAGKVKLSNATEIDKDAGKIIGTVTLEAEGPNGEKWATVVTIKFAA